ncbi:bacteriocin biosynthesis protein, partial [Actinomyces oris]
MARDATGSVMRAGDVGRAARRDLQFRIPRRPVVRLGLRARPEETGWIIDGARKSQVLGGAFAREHMGPLLQACDGTRTLDEIGEVTGIGPQAAFEAVSLLWTGGIVEEGDTEPAPGDPAPELARLLSRLGDSTGVNDSWQDAARRLAAARVAVVGDAELAGEMVAVLEATLPEVRLDSAPRRGDTLTVLIETVDSTDRSQEVARRCREEGIALLRVRAEQEAVTVGPYVDEAFSPCLACACADEPEIGPRPEAARRDIVVGLAARAVAALIARATVTHLPGDARRTDLATFTYSDRPVVSRPGCPVCSVAGAGEEPVPVAPSAPVGARYEQSVAIPPAAFVDSKGHQQHYKPSNLRLQREFRDWPVCPRTPLPPADLERLDQPWPITHPLTDDGSGTDVVAHPTLGELATILALSVGVREPLGEPT